MDKGQQVNPRRIEEATDDAALVARFKAGDEAAFAQIVASHRARLYLVVFNQLHDHGDTEEIVQDAFIRAHKALAKFRGDSSLATWLYCIARNLALNRYWYFKRRHRHSMRSLDCPISDENSGTIADLIADHAPNPAQAAVVAEWDCRVAVAMGRIKAKDRQILDLIAVSRQSYAEVGATLGCPVGTVKSRVSRARSALQAQIVLDCPIL